MTKQELRAELLGGKCLDELFPFRCGQECFIYKSSFFIADDHIRYIPDIDLNNIPVDDVLKYEDIDDVISMCYTGNDFVEECGGDAELASELFYYVDWQHPSSAVDEVRGDEEDDRSYYMIHLEQDRKDTLLVNVIKWLKTQMSEDTVIGNLLGIGFLADDLINYGCDVDKVTEVVANWEDDLPFI